MLTRAWSYRLTWFVVLSIAWLGGLAPCMFAKNNGGNNNNNNNNNNLLSNVGGVLVDADGVVRMKSVADPTGQLHRERLSAARSSLDQKLAARSALRKVSLTRLEAAIAEKLSSGAQPNDEMRYLAGLTRVQFVFFYPDTNDIVLAGPAEGFAADLSGRVRGIESGQPVLQLSDLIVALRAFFGPSAQEGPVDQRIDRSDTRGPGRYAAILAASRLAPRRPKLSSLPMDCARAWGCR